MLNSEWPFRFLFTIRHLSLTIKEVLTTMGLGNLYRAQMAWKLSALVALSLCLAAAAQGQVPAPTQQPAPPPLKLMTPAESAKLSEARDAKARIHTTIELAELRLTQAESLTANQQYDNATTVLGGYQGLIENAFHYLHELKVEQKKLRDIYKSLELALRAHGARIEAMRRITPVEFGINLKTIAQFTREARTDALNSFYGDTVVRESSDENRTAPETPKEPNTAPPKKP